MADLEADDFADSTYGEEISTYSASLTSSAYNFPETHGRTYHAYREGRYFLPNDERESDRLDIHSMLVRRVMDDKLYHAPLVEGQVGRALDLATGTGLWAIEFADQHPEAEVLANDLSPTQPQWVPPNLKFLVDDIEEDWHYEDQPFDFIHACFLVGAIRDWPRLMRQAYTCVKPGGWVEFQDWDVCMYSQDDSFPDDCALKSWNSNLIKTRESMGYDTRPGRSLEQRMRDAGFVDISATKIPVPFGPWAKDKRQKQLGTLNYLQLDSGLDGIGLSLTQGPSPMTVEEVHALLVEVRKNMNDRAIHSMYDFYIVYGRKPPEEESASPA